MFAQGGPLRVLTTRLYCLGLCGGSVCLCPHRLPLVSGRGAAVTSRSHSLCLETSPPFSPPSSRQTPAGPVKPSETITSSPESPRLHLLSPCLSSCGVPLGGEERREEGHVFWPSPTWAERRLESAPSGQAWGRMDVRGRMALAQLGERWIDQPLG